MNEYYYGTRTNIQRAHVESIMDTVVEELLKDERRRFVYVEMAYFSLWFNRQTPQMQETVRKLVKEERLQFAGGAWTANDEATVHYQSVIDQFTLGLQFLAATFDKCARPRVGWQIDAFGHSEQMPSILAQMGYDGQFFARVDFEEKKGRMNNHSAEMIWQASASQGERSEIFSSILYKHYSAPTGFCFDILCTDDPIVDDDNELNNVEDKVDEFIDYILGMSEHYRATDLLVPMGDDFHYMVAARNFNNMDKLIKYVNARQVNGSNVNVFYSTPGCYLQALHRAQLTWPTKTQDFFPYADKPHAYWTGYFTSRPTFKYFIRLGNHFLQVVKQLAALSKLHNIPDAMNNLNKLKQSLGIMQHHDAITGTCKQHVVNDYTRILSSALTLAEHTAKMALQKLTSLKTGQFVSCLQLNISICEFTQNRPNNLLVTVYNPLTRATKQYVRIPVPRGYYMVKDFKGNAVKSQLVPLPEELIALKYLRPNLTQYDLVFEAEVEKLGHYHIKSTNGDFESQNVSVDSEMKELSKEPQGEMVGNSLVKLFFDNNGFLWKVEMNGVSANVSQKFLFYEATKEGDKQTSGAYISAPLIQGANIRSFKIDLKIYDGPLVKEIHQHFNNWTSQVIRIYEGVSRVEFEWLIGPIPVGDRLGKEVVTVFSSDIRNQYVFHTDSNGREMINRKRNIMKEIPGNYYPITGRIVLEDDKKRMTLLNDRAQGGSCLGDGTLELMLHRRLLHDDSRGLGEPLNDTTVARGKIYMILNSADNDTATEERLIQQELHLPVWLFFSRSFLNVNSTVNGNFSSLPEGIEVLTLEPFTSLKTLLRLENMFDKSSITFNLKPFLMSLKAEKIYETTIDGNMLLKDMKRLKFQKDENPVKNLEYYIAKHRPLEEKLKAKNKKFEITMEPMEIRTFIITHKNFDVEDIQLYANRHQLF
uniref:Alpha-mannosidase n=1 Tax=Glossina morsitans morsitans TaxID=37546 RepID=A0A240SWY6_GLOMM